MIANAASTLLGPSPPGLLKRLPKWERVQGDSKTLTVSAFARLGAGEESAAEANLYLTSRADGVVIDGRAYGGPAAAAVAVEAAAGGSSWTVEQARAGPAAAELPCAPIACRPAATAAGTPREPFEHCLSARRGSA